MKIYSKRQEQFLSYIGYQSTVEEGVTWKGVLYSGLESYAHWFVSTDQVYERGLDVEALTLALTKDEDKAWEAAEPYYRYAEFRGHAEAAYRYAQHEEQNYGVGEFGYSLHLERAVKNGHKQAIHDFVYKYDEFKPKTITKDSWSRKRRTEKLFFQCCKTLAEEGDIHALWELGTCYLFGTGVKKDRTKGVVIRDQAMKQMDLDDDELEKMTAIQDFFKEDSLNERDSFGKYFFSELRKLLSMKKDDHKP